MLSHYYFETGKKEMSIWTIINTAVSLVSIRKEKQRNGWILRFSLWHFEAGNKIIIRKYFHNEHDEKSSTTIKQHVGDLL